MSAHPDVFLDRDSVIIRGRRDYIPSLEQVEPLPGSAEAIGRLRAGVAGAGPEEQSYRDLAARLAPWD